MRLNQLIARLEQGRPAFSATLRTGDVQRAIQLGDSDMDFVIVDLEHEGFDFPVFGQTLQWLISRRQVAQAPGAASPTPIARLPHHAGEPTRWIAAQALDYGVFGLVVPYVESADDLQQIVTSIRYPQPAGAPGPVGQRGVWPRLAMRYWGMQEFDEYVARADLWPLAPDGEIFLIAMVATQRGADNINEIVRVPGIGGVLYGPKHAWISLGRRGPVDLDDPQLAGIRSRLVEACLDTNVALGTSATGESPTGGVQRVDSSYLRRRMEEGFRFFLTPHDRRPVVDDAPEKTGSAVR